MAFSGPTFFTNRFASVWVSAAPVLVAAVGMTLVILARHIDISIGAQVSICAVVAGLTAKGGAPISIIALSALGTGAFFGMVNGTLVAIFGFPSIVATLATMVILQQSLRWLGQGQSVLGLPDWFQWFGAGQTGGQILIVGLALVLFIAFAWGMRWIAAGREVFAVGSDPEAARLAGIRPDRVVFSVFVLMGLLSGLAALLAAVRFPQVDPKVGDGLELQVIAAVVVGGTAISGGRGTLIGTFLGVALLGTVGAALGFVSDQAYWDKAVQGLIILAAVMVDGFRKRGALS